MLDADHDAEEDTNALEFAGDGRKISSQRNVFVFSGSPSATTRELRIDRRARIQPPRGS
jgi:hypothetical protein